MNAREILALLYSELDTSHRELAEVLGREQRTVGRALEGKPMSEAFQSFLRRLKSVEVFEGEAVLRLRISNVRKRAKVRVISR